jgi:hypothetical protein
VRFTADQIRKIIREEMTGHQEPSLGRKARLSSDSLDDQLDSLFIKFESESIKTEAIRSLFNLMFEAPEDEEKEEEDLEAGEAPAPGEEEPAEQPSSVGSEERDEEVSGEPGRPPLDMDQFTHRVVRLIENYDSLLDIRTVILNRAANYVLENYDEAAVGDFEDTLEIDHGLSLDPKDNEQETPMAIGAGPAGGA